MQESFSRLAREPADDPFLLAFIVGERNARIELYRRRPPAAHHNVTHVNFGRMCVLVRKVQFVFATGIVLLDMNHPHLSFAVVMQQGRRLLRVESRRIVLFGRRATTRKEEKSGRPS